MNYYSSVSYPSWTLFVMAYVTVSQINQTQIYLWEVKKAENCFKSFKLRLLLWHQPPCSFNFFPVRHLVLLVADEASYYCVISKFDDVGFGLSSTGSVNSLNSRGLSTQPWGAPMTIVLFPDALLLMSTVCGLDSSCIVECWSPAGRISSSESPGVCAG